MRVRSKTCRHRNMVADTAFYDLLGVDPSCTETELKKAYRTKSLQHHPDKNLDNPEGAQAKFQEIQHAYQTLSDPQDRAAYDNYGPSFNDRRGGGGGGGGGGGAYGPSAEDLFESMFGAGRSGAGHYHSRTRSKPAPKKGKNTVIVYDVTLEDLYNGKTVTMSLERQGICGTCSGTGGKKGARSKTCVKCSGKGKIMVNRLLSGGLMAQSQALCPVCDGQGTKIRDVDQCRKCKGEKTTKEKKKTTWHIEKGMIDGQRVTLREHGDQYPGAPTGDVVFVLKLQPHQTLKQSSEYDLMATISVTLSEALTGFSRVVFHHLDGRGISVTVPPGRVINNGDSFKVEGEGMPIERSERRGDLWLKFELEKIDEDWAKNVDLEALAKLLPSKRQNVVPKPEIVDDVTLKLDDNPPQPREPRPQQSQYYEEEEDQQDYYDDSDDDGGMPAECQQQ